ncbi:DUF4197 domain-containing protein [Flavobacterium litorale]|uniref:DUF4197 domain-containing protein n=1 Tax=Flavobacterium litorale TaxID=2856519 RepID=A0ABX8V3M1_9FLAO|nr:DUF4197 domain-containing protein [Flavobacterium litorale]QYJ67441.1 DUF4197 domain-containing protein [Flavobacterium litorale]
MRRVLVVTLTFVLFTLSGCAELQQIASQLPDAGGVGLSNADIAAGLKEALDKGIDKQVAKLTKTDGFYRNQAVKILLPQELQDVDKTLRKIGLGNLADKGLKMMNRAAEDAVKEATPIFVDAVKNMTFNDAKNILMGADNSATNYLQSATSAQLYTKFNPVIKSSFNKVGADKVWSSIISKYNTVPFVEKVNPDLTDYVTNKALEGVFTMIAVEEKEIRTDINERTSTLLKKVFALQD